MPIKPMGNSVPENGAAQAIPVTGLEFNLGGEVRQWKFGLRACEYARVNHGFKIGANQLSRIDDDYSLYQDILWVGFLRYDPGLKRETVIEWLDADGVNEWAIIQKLQAFLVAFLSQAAEPETAPAA